MDLSKYLGILRWSLKYNDGTSDTKFTEMDEERKKWLQAAIAEQVVDPADQMKALISIIQMPRVEPESEEGSSPSEDQDGKKFASQQEEEFVTNKVDTLLALRDWVDQIDWAADLHKMGGFQTVIDLMSDPNESIRCGAMEVFATVVQNNPKPQEWAMEMKALDKLVANFDKEGLSAAESAKTLFGISTLIRECTAATVAFIKDHKGVALLLKAIAAAPETHVRTTHKSLFLMRYILDIVPIIRSAAPDSLIQTFNECILSQDVDVRENALHLLILMYTDRNMWLRLSPTIRAGTVENLKQFETGAKHFSELDEGSQELSQTLKKAMIEMPTKEGPAEPTMMLGN